MPRETNGINMQLKVMAAWLLLVWVLAAINPYSRQDWLLENLLVFLSAIILITTYRKFAFSLQSYWLFTLFMTLHLIGSHYTYAETPAGYWMQEAFDLKRNHYDRVVHLSFGLLLASAFREILERQISATRLWINILTLSIVLSFSAIYELVEMAAAIVVSPELGSAFLGTQGDEWDAQKDTGLAFLGALLSVLIRR